MLKIRLTRKGKKNSAFYRLVVAEHTSPIKGRFVEVLGFFNPHTKEKNFKADRVKYWIEKGAQCSDTAHNLLVSAKIISEPKRAIKMKKKEAPAAPESEAKPTESEKKEEAPAKEEKVEKTQVEAKDQPETRDMTQPAEEKKEAETEEKPVAEEKKPEEQKS